MVLTVVIDPVFVNKFASITTGVNKSPHSNFVVVTHVKTLHILKNALLVIQKHIV